MSRALGELIFLNNEERGWVCKGFVLSQSLKSELSERRIRGWEEGAERGNAKVVLRLSVQTLCCPQTRGEETRGGTQQPASLLLFPVPAHRSECLHSARITNATSAFKVEYGSVVKASRSSCRCSSFVAQATAHARGAQAAAQRQRGIEQRLKEKMNWHYTVPRSVKTAI